MNACFDPASIRCDAGFVRDLPAGLAGLPTPDGDAARTAGVVLSFYAVVVPVLRVVCTMHGVGRR